MPIVWLIFMRTTENVIITFNLAFIPHALLIAVPLMIHTTELCAIGIIFYIASGFDLNLKALKKYNL